MAKIKQTLIFGSSGDIGKGIKKIISDNKIIEINSKNLDLANINSVKNFKFNYAPDHIIFVSAQNKPKLFLNQKDKEIEDSLNINLISFIYILKKLLPKIIKSKKKTKIIIITSLYSKFGRSGRLLYSVSKHALLGLTRNLALELGHLGITVNAVSPGYVDTKMTRRNLSKKEIIFLKNKTPLRKLISVNDISHIVKILLSKDCSSITGQEITVDGGISINGSFGL
ncbi:SDR family oxidoreductase [Candidatus Pelagibacter ubique]|nr:SDR family oxidoreductase [Candidatus Pelagibacter ubique]